MGTLYLDHQDLELRQDGKSLLLHRQGARPERIPLHLVDSIVIQAQLQMDTNLLANLANEGIHVTILGGRFHRKCAFVQGLWHNDVTRRVGQVRAYDDPGWRRQWGNRLLRHKLAAQARFLQHLSRSRPDKRYPLTRALCHFSQVRSVLATSIHDPESLLGFEGAAARQYFAALAETLPPALAFSGRNRRPPRDPFNALLSLGYTLLHAQAVRQISIAGLDPFLGFVHTPSWGRESLAADLIEPFRPRIDALCWQLCSQRVLTADHFSTKGEACLLGKAGRRHFYAAYEAQRGLADRALRRLAQRLAAAFAVRGANNLTIESSAGEDPR